MIPGRLLVGTDSSSVVEQTNVIDGVPRLGQRSVTVSVVCAPQCRFWSATSEMPT